MSASNIIFDLGNSHKLPDTKKIMIYGRNYIPIDDDRWGSIFITKDVFRMLIKLKVI